MGYGDHITLTYGGSVASDKSVRYTVPNGVFTYLGTVDAQGKTAKFTMPGDNTTITKTDDAHYTFGGITLRETFSGNESQGLDATFDGSSEVTVSIPNDITVKSVTYDREFTAGKPATVMLPFGYTCNGSEGGKFYTFIGVEYDDNKSQWVAIMNESYDPVNKVDALVANTPYIFMADDGEMRFPNITGSGVTLCTNGDHYSRDVRGWEFRGVYQKTEWDAPSNDYGFAATSGRDAANEQDVSVGQFVRFTGNGTKNAFIKPMRCYLHFDPDITANARSVNRAAAADELPQTITVRLVNRNGDATDIGTIDTRTGEISTDGWYTLDGTRLNGKPATKGIYINNGKKIVIK